MSDLVPLGNDLPVVSVWEEDTAADVWRWIGELAGCEGLRWKIVDLDDGDWTLTLPLDGDGSDMFTEGRLAMVEWRGYASSWEVVPHPSTDSDTNLPRLEVNGPGAFSRLGWEAAWPNPALPLNDAGQATATPTKGPAETVLKTIIRQNLITRRGMSLVIPTDQARGDTITATPDFGKLSDLVTQLAPVGAVTVTVGLERRAPGSTYADLVCRVRPRDDLTADVHLTADAHTIDSFDLTPTPPTMTQAIVAGAGTGGLDRIRQIVTTPESEAAAAQWGGHRVGFVDGPGSFDPDELTQAGKEALASAAATYGVSLTAADVDGQMAFRDYPPGALVTVQPLSNGPVLQEIVTSIETTVSAEDGVVVQPTIGDPATDPDEVISDSVLLLQRAVRSIQRKR